MVHKAVYDMAREHNAVPVLVTAPARTALTRTEQLKMVRDFTAVIISAI